MDASRRYVLVAAAAAVAGAWVGALPSGGYVRILTSAAAVVVVAPTFAALHAWYVLAHGDTASQPRKLAVAGLLTLGALSALGLLAEVNLEQSLLGPYYSAQRRLAIVMNVALAVGLWAGSRCAAGSLGPRVRVLAAALGLAWAYALLTSFHW